VLRDTNRLAINAALLTGEPDSLIYTIMRGGSSDSYTPTWLSQLRIDFREGATVQNMDSVKVKFTTTVTRTCDLQSCLGCQTSELVTMCNIAQQCAVQKCVGATVVQNRPLCNIGLTIRNVMDLYLTTLYTAWLQFSDTLENVLSTIISPSISRKRSTAVIDDGFFGAICTAKDIAASGSAIITSTAASLLVTSHNSRYEAVPVIQNMFACF
jgi:hypothetical protein